MMTHLGVLSQVNEQAAVEVFHRDCLVPLGTVIAPVGRAKEGEVILEWQIGEETGELRAGELRLLPLAAGEERESELRPRRGMDAGAGRGRHWSGLLAGGTVGVIFDGRGRPLRLRESESERPRRMGEWLRAVGALPGGTV